MKKLNLWSHAGFVTALVSLVAISVLLSPPLKSQSFYGSIVGTVTDASGAIVPSANVTITNIGTNETRTDKTDASGAYRFVNLVPANYKVEVTKANFKRFLRSPIPVQVGNTTRVDVDLQVGAATETVEVTTQVPLLQTDSGTLGAEVEGKRVQEMPLNGRNTMNLIALAPGVVPQGSAMGSTTNNQGGGNTSPGGWGNYQVGGGIAGQQAEFVDGVPVNTLGSQNGLSLVPTQDAVQEFNVSSSGTGADFGRYGGGVVNMTTKSGANEFHGSAYEYLRNTALNANSYFNKSAEVQLSEANKPTKFNQNQYGVVFNGPIKKDKAFFLFTWEGFKSRIGYASPATVPTADMINGTIPAVYSHGNLENNIQDPLGHCTITPNGPSGTPTSFTVTDNGSGKCFDPTAALFKQYYALPTPGFSDPANDNYFIDAVIGNNQNQYNGRVDYNLSANQRLFARYTYWNITDIPFNEFPSAKYDVGDGGSLIRTHQAVIGDTYTFSPKTVLDVRLSLMRNQSFGSLADMNVDQAIFGSAFGALSSQELLHVYPTFAFGSGGGPGGPPGGGGGGASSAVHNLYASWANGLNEGYYDNYFLSGNLVRMIGRHSLKIGAEFRLMDAPALGNSGSPSFAFSGNKTNDEWADFLLGYTATGSINSGIWTTDYDYYQAYYLQDTWQASRKLTITGGVRWELPGGQAEKKNMNTVLLPTATDPSTQVTGTLALVASSLYAPRTILEVKHDLFAPNLGFAYRLNSDTVVRGGYGLSWLPPDLTSPGPGSGPSNSPINSSSTSYTNSGSAVNTNTYLYQAFENVNGGKLNALPGRVANFMATIPLVAAQQQSISGWVPTDPYGYTQQWNLSLSRQMKGNWMVEASYAGTKGTHEPALGGTLDQLNPTIVASYGSPAAAYAALEANTSQTTPGGVTQNVTVGRSLQPLPYYSSVTDNAAHWGATTYQAMQLRAEKRFGSGGVLMAGYTWSKMIGDTDTGNGNLEVHASPTTHSSGEGNLQNYWDHKADRSIMSYNTPQRLVVSYVLNLPFGQGQRWANSGGGALSRLASGWAVNGITTFQDGFPININEGAQSAWGDFDGGTIRPDYTPGATGCNGKKTISGSAVKRLGEWFNTACFTEPATFTVPGPGGSSQTKSFGFGNEPRVDGTLRSEGIDNWDLSLLKSTKITERTNFQFRAEFFNIANRVQFAPPVNSNDSQGFGGILAQGNQPRLIQVSGRLTF
jgi:hypothetical protein